MLDGLMSLYEVVSNRKEVSVEGSYTCYLFDQGVNKILKKCGEECSEMIIAAKDGERSDLIDEMCDLIYHMTVLMVVQNINIKEIDMKLLERSRKIGNLKVSHVSNHNS